MKKPVKIVKDTKYPQMYRLEWSDGVLSQDFYNKTRAKDILKHYDDYLANMKHSVKMQEDWQKTAS